MNYTQSTDQRRHPVNTVTFSGNHATYSIDRIIDLFGIDNLEEIETSFTFLSNVKFNTDRTLSIYHYGKFDDGTFNELKKIIYILNDKEKLIAFGFDYTNMKPLLIILDNYGVKIVPYKIKVGYTRHSTIVEEISETIPIDMDWANYKNQSDFHYPALLNVIEPDNFGFEIGDEYENFSSEQSGEITPNSRKET